MSENPPGVAWFEAIDYRRLIGEKSWHRLHPDIQRRFALPQAHRSVTYRGTMHEVYLSRAGRLLAFVCRLIGTPLALYPGRNVPMKVDVYPDPELPGMTWDRHYLYRHRRTNRVRSTKCILPETGLVEVVGCGFGMHLKIFERERALVFESRRFFWQSGGLRIPIPSLLTPGKTVVRQRALDDGSFEFSLDVRHPLLGQVFYQIGNFIETE